MYASMRKGGAVFPRVGPPNTNTNISVAAHRTGSAAFFFNFDKVQLGDTVFLHTRTLGSFRYVVEDITVINNNDWTKTQAVGYPTLTLLTCERGVNGGNTVRFVLRCALRGIAR